MKKKKNILSFFLVFSIIVGFVYIPIATIYKNKKDKPFIEIKDRTLNEAKKFIENKNYIQAERKLNYILNNKNIMSALNKDEKFTIYNYLGVVNLQQGKFLNAIIDYEKSNKYANKNNKLKSLINISIAYRDSGEYIKSSEMLIKVSKEKIHYNSEYAYIKAYALINLAEVDIRIENISEFRIILNKVKKLLEYIPEEYKEDIEIMYYTYRALDSIYDNDLKNAQNCLNEIENLEKKNKEIDFTELDILKLRAYGCFYEKKGEYKKAEECFEKLEVEANKEGSTYIELFALSRRINFFKNYNEAEYINLLKRYYYREEEIGKLNDSQYRYHLNNEFIKEVNNSISKEFIVTMFIVFIILSILIILLIKKIKKSKKESMKDPLCDIYNRRFLDKYMKDISKRDMPISVVMIDVDYFKLYNDNYGHQQGDMVLKNVSNVLKKSCRKDDIVARYGGEEFCIILRHTDKYASIELAKRIKYNMMKANILHEFSKVEKVVTLSIGIATIYSLSDVENIIKLADKSLYTIKKSGRNGYIHIEDIIKKDLID